ncbi:MAG: hypothetical protein MZU97_19965 [Bacillus subtilis]|nr:hypothetical protein [Bacillus subtilis]
MKRHRSTAIWPSSASGLRTIRFATRERRIGANPSPSSVNGIEIFAKGADYIPEDNLLGQNQPRRSPSDLLESRRGGESQHGSRLGRRASTRPITSSICATNSACSSGKISMFALLGLRYERPSARRRPMTEEIIDNLRRFRHHACLALDLRQQRKRGRDRPLGRSIQGIVEAILRRTI